MAETNLTEDPSSPTQQPQAKDKINITTLNCWGLLYISKHRTERLSHIGHLLAHSVPNDPSDPENTSPPIPDIVCLQECWTQQDYQSIRSQTQHLLPYSKFYHSGVLGAGLAILSRWPIAETNMHAYPLNGRPTAFFRGDWYVGKGVACARISVPKGGFSPRLDADLASSHDQTPNNNVGEEPGAEREDDAEIIEVFTTHLHAPYEREPHDSYLCHRTAQAYFISKLVRDAQERGHLAIACGDFNMEPTSLAYSLVTIHGRVIDVWGSDPEATIPNRMKEEHARMEHGKKGLSVRHKILREGCTCDSAGNTWRWPEKRRKTLQQSVKRGREVADQDKRVDWDDEESPWAKRLDYIFFGQPFRDINGNTWDVERKAVGMTHQHPTLLCSLSDHFAVEASLVRRSRTAPTETHLEHAVHPTQMHPQISPFEESIHPHLERILLPRQTYSQILQLTETYIRRERFQRKGRITHFFVAVAITIGCWIAVWWSPRNFVAFILMLLASLGLMAGAVDGLIGFLFVGSEMACLKEFRWEMENLEKNAVETT